MPVKTVNSGRSTTQRGGEQALIADSIYSQSIIQAQYGSWAGAGNAWAPATWTGAQITAGVTIQTLVFTSDYPVFYGGLTNYGPSDAGAVLTSSSWVEAVAQEGDPATFANVLSADLTTYDAKQRIFGDSATNSIPLGGYALLFTVGDRGLANGGNPLGSSATQLWCFCENGVVSGNPVNFLGGANNAPAPTLQVILKESDYTQAIFNANNTFTDSNGLVCKVVGLCYNTNL